MKKTLILLLSVLLMTGLLTSCKKKKGDPPVLPDAESMVIDFSNFELGKSGDLLSLEKGVENSNWEFAATVAGYWIDILTGTLIVPVSAFKLAVNQTPEWLEENTWEWNYSASVLSATYNARLVGQIRASDVLWTMYISGGSITAEFVWFEGTSATDGSSGQWVLNHSYADQTPVLQIDWTKTGDEIGTITYTYVKSDDRYGSYIEYGKTSNTLDAYYSIHYYSTSYQTFWDVDVEWSTTGYNGRVMCSPWFGDSDWHCWNSQLVNITCE